MHRYATLSQRAPDKRVGSNLAQGRPRSTPQGPAERHTHSKPAQVPQRTVPCAEPLLGLLQALSCVGTAAHRASRPARAAPQAWAALDSAVAAIRQQEAALGQAPHIVTVQGTRGWARELAYYVDHPITAGGGKNVVYETHPCG